jgi:NAD(P)H-hydrate repair Nnr-like enzyme with NAD(P)H-hydrate dehydratase domain
VRRAADRYRCVVLLKGADTLVAAPGEGVLVSASGTPALATAGTGDVLTGVVAAFLAKGMDARLAAAAAAFTHGRAAELAPQQVGLVASDVIAALPQALS